MQHDVCGHGAKLYPIRWARACRSARSRRLAAPCPPPAPRGVLRQRAATPPTATVRGRALPVLDRRVPPSRDRRDPCDVALSTTRSSSTGTSSVPTGRCRPELAIDAPIQPDGERVFTVTATERDNPAQTTAAGLRLGAGRAGQAQAGQAVGERPLPRPGLHRPRRGLRALPAQGRAAQDGQARRRRGGPVRHLLDARPAVPVPPAARDVARARSTSTASCQTRGLW